MRQFCFASLLSLHAFALAGCGGGSPTTATSNPSPAANANVEVSLAEARFEQLEGAVSAQKGKVVLMDFWATWCGPCVKKFPHFVEVHKKYSGKGLVCISASLDPRGKDDKYDKDEVLKFLKEKDARFSNFVLLGYAQDSEKIDKHFGLEGGIPFMVMFDKTGNRVWTSEEKSLGDAELDKLIEVELAK